VGGWAVACSTVRWRAVQCMQAVMEVVQKVAGCVAGWVAGQYPAVQSPLC
jgi:hypothetical protein